LKVLVADDQIFNRKVASVMLEKMGHAVVTAVDGKAALAAVERGPFDIIFMDVQMPEMDGLETTAAIRRAEQASGGHVPIVALTAFAMKGDRERFLAAGFDAHVPKPIQSSDLSHAIEHLVPNPGGRHANECPPGPLVRSLAWTAGTGALVVATETSREDGRV
jgi:CheY-like chemotaxis protein